jgi:hypothetical protein
MCFVFACKKKCRELTTMGKGPARGDYSGEPGTHFLFIFRNGEVCCDYGSHWEWELLGITFVHHTGVSVVHHTGIRSPVLLIQDDMEQIIHMKLILYMFEAMSGLKINFLKSEIMMILHDDEKKLLYSNIFGCQLEDWPTKPWSACLWN